MKLCQGRKWVMVMEAYTCGMVCLTQAYRDY